jgi:hypothetical protein
MSQEKKRFEMDGVSLRKPSAECKVPKKDETIPGLLISVAESVPIVSPIAILSIGSVSAVLLKKGYRKGIEVVSIDTPIPILRLSL